MKPLASTRSLYTLAWLLVFLPALTAADPRPQRQEPKAAEPDFAGKLLLIGVKNPAGAGGLLRDVKVSRLGGRTFLVGQLVGQDDDKKPPADPTYWIPVDEVTQIWEFKSLEEVRKYYESRKVPISLKRVEGEEDVYEMPTRQFLIPLAKDPDRVALIARVRLFVSEDRGKSWAHHKDLTPDEENARFSAPRDGLYWFAVQVVYKDDTQEPAGTEGLVAALKVRVNTRPMPVAPPDR